MQKVSVFIITLNEEDNIRRCLEGVRWADEIVVSDSGSTDRTIDICEEFNAKVYHDRWFGFGRQKNLCMGRTKNRWVLNIDADERVTEELTGEIQRVLEDEERDGYYIPRKNYFLGEWIRHCGWYPDYNLRLFRKDKGGFNERAVHEAVSIDGKVGHLKAPMEHYTYKDITSYIKRMEKYSTLAAQEMVKEGRRSGYMDLLLRPAITFIRMFILRMGFLEGYRGLVLSGLYASYTLAKYAKLWELQGKGE